jgi:endogenous inhibitor of DNA gyrase (YacG/DUF329 family)
MSAKLENLAAHRRARQATTVPPEEVASASKAGVRGCPICGARPIDRHRPFCSPRCVDIDLGRWLSESYRIPADETAATVESAEFKAE